MKILIGVVAFIVFASSCGGDPCCGAVCVPPLCPQQIAFDVTVTTAAGTAIPGLAYSISGPSGPAGCLVVNGVTSPPHCEVTGSRGTYHFTISAPGFTSVQQTVQVTSSGTHGCDTCDIPDTQHFSFVLAPA